MPPSHARHFRVPTMLFRRLLSLLTVCASQLPLGFVSCQAQSLWQWWVRVPVETGTVWLHSNAWVKPLILFVYATSSTCGLLALTYIIFSKVSAAIMTMDAACWHHRYLHERVFLFLVKPSDLTGTDCLPFPFRLIQNIRPSYRNRYRVWANHPASNDYARRRDYYSSLLYWVNVE